MKSFIIDLLPDVGVYATTLKGDLCVTCIPNLATKFSCRKDAISYLHDNFSDYKCAKVRSLASLNVN